VASIQIVRPRISVVIPNWNGAARLKRVLECLDLQTERACEVLVVDNASSDASNQFAKAHPAVTWIPLDRNYGFARAVNTGIARSTGDGVAILNNDVTFGPDFLSCLAGALENHHFVAPKIVMASGSARLDGTFDLTNRGFCSWRAGHGSPADAPMWNEPRVIASAPMTAGLFRRSLFDRTGLLDEQFGSYLEDVDFGLRCALLGLNGYYEPAAVAVHEGSATLGGEWNHASVRWIARNQAVLARKYGVGLNWPVFAGQILWGLSALKRGAGRAWIQGKIEGCRIEVTPAAPAFENENADLNQILRLQEHEIRDLLQQSGAHERYWRAYSALTGGAQ
jgi:hypothetical protein